MTSSYSFYSADIEPGDGVKQTFGLTFDYVDRNSVYVYLIENADGAITELTAITAGSPGSGEYVWDSDTQVTLGDIPSTDQSVKIQRRTLLSQQEVQWQDASYIIADDLNTSEKQSLYLDQELHDWLSEITGGGSGPGDFVDLDNLGDVTITNEQDLDLLAYDGPSKEWVNKSPITEAAMLAGQTSADWVDGALSTAGAQKQFFNPLLQVFPPTDAEVYEAGKFWYQSFETASGNKFNSLNIYNGTDWENITKGQVVPVPFFPQSIIYVDPQGNDSNPGRSPDAAYRTIGAAVADANKSLPTTVSTVSTATYDNVSGFIAYTTTSAHDLSVGFAITITPSIWSCSGGNDSYPPVAQEFLVSSTSSPTQFLVYVGPSSTVHTYVSGGVITPDAAMTGDGTTILCAPGVYHEKLPITLEAKNLSIIGSSLRNTYIHPDIYTSPSGQTPPYEATDRQLMSPIGTQQGVDIYQQEVQIMFEMDSGSYLRGFTFCGLKSLGDRGVGGDDPDPTYGLPAQQGWVSAHRQDSFITKSPYIQNCTNFSDLQTNNAVFDINSLAGEGGDVTSGPAGGGVLVDGDRVNPSSPLKSYVVDAFTQIALGGPGVLATNNSYAQLVSFFGTFCFYHAKALNGSQLNLSNCTTDFGEYGLIAAGRSPNPVITGSVSGNYPAGNPDPANVSKVEITVTGLTLAANFKTNQPGPTQVVTIGSQTYMILSATKVSLGVSTIKLLNPNVNNRSLDDGLVDPISNGASAEFRLQSYISTGGHTFEFAGSGTDYRAHPDYGGQADESKQVKELGGTGTNSAFNGGKVWLSSTDEEGVFKVGDTFQVNQKTGFVTFDPASVATIVVSDPTPDLGGDLDVNGYKILGDRTGANGDIKLETNLSSSVDIQTSVVNIDGKITATDRINVGANPGTSTSNTAGAALYGLDGSITAYKKSTDVSPFFTGTKYASSVSDRFKFIVHNDGELVINPVSNTKGVPAAITLGASGTVTASNYVATNEGNTFYAFASLNANSGSTFIEGTSSTNVPYAIISGPDNGSGNADFAVLKTGAVHIGQNGNIADSIYSNPRIKLKPDGFAEFVGNVSSDGRFISSRVGGTSTCFSAQTAGVQKAEIRANGSSEFLGNLQVGESLQTTGQGVLLIPTGSIYANKDTNDNPAIEVRDTGVSRMQIRNNGDVRIGGALSGDEGGLGDAPNIKLLATGKAVFAGAITSGSDSIQGGSNAGVNIVNAGYLEACRNNGLVFRAYNFGDIEPKVFISSDGTAQFAKTVGIGGIIGSNPITSIPNIQLNAVGLIDVYRPSTNPSGNSIFRLYGDVNGGTRVNVLRQFADGTVALGNPGTGVLNNPTDGNITLGADGSSVFNSAMVIKRDIGGVEIKSVQASQNGTKKFAYGCSNSFSDDATQLNLYLYTDGSIAAVNTTIQPISSERRLKENIVAIDANAAWETVKSTPYYAYNFIGSELTSYGPMADEVPAEMVINTDRVDDKGPIRTYDNGMLQARLYTALQTALTRIEALEAEVNALKGA